MKRRKYVWHGIFVTDNTNVTIKNTEDECFVEVLKDRVNSGEINNIDYISTLLDAKSRTVFGPGTKMIVGVDGNVSKQMPAIEHRFFDMLENMENTAELMIIDKNSNVITDMIFENK